MRHRTSAPRLVAHLGDTLTVSARSVTRDARARARARARKVHRGARWGPVATLAAKAGRQPVDFIDRFQGCAIKSHTFTIYPGQESSQEGRPGLKKCTRIGRKGMPRGRGWVLRGGCGDRAWEVTIEL